MTRNAKVNIDEVRRLINDLEPILEKICLKRHGSSLEGSICGEASSELASLLQKINLESNPIVLPSHCVLITTLKDSEYVIDPTIRQYFSDMPKIWFGSKDNYLKLIKDRMPEKFYLLKFRNLIATKSNRRVPFPNWGDLSNN